MMCPREPIGKPGDQFIMIDSTRGPGGPLPLDAFRESARQGESVQVSIDGQDFKVLAQGQLQGQATGNRSVAWVQGDIDTTSLFVQSLAQSVGGGLSSAVARELGLDPGPGQALSSRAITQALDMAETGRQALSGVDFLTRLEHSASAQGPGFQAAIASLGIDASAVTPQQRQQLDERMQGRFDAAAAQGQSPVSSATAATWLRAELAALGHGA